MKIGMFTDAYLPSVNGVATSVDALARELEGRGHQVTIVAPKYPKYKDVRPGIIRINAMSMPRKKDIRIATYLPGASLVLASQLDLDIVHGHSGGPVSMLGWEVARVKRIPYVFTYHTMFNQYTHYILKGKLIKPKAAEIVSKLFGNAADCLIAPTIKVEDELLRYGVRKPIVVIPSSTDLNKFKPGPAGFLRQAANLGSQNQVILFVGRLGKEKSVDLAIRAFAQITPKYPMAHFVIVGDGPERQDLENLAFNKLNLENRIHFTGFVSPDNIPRAYADANLLLFCSTTETQGLVVPEALASGLPALVAKDKAYDHIIHHRQTGLVAPQNTPQSFARQLEWALDNPQAMTEMANRARLAMAAYTPAKTADRFEDIYTKLVSSSHLE